MLRTLFLAVGISATVLAMVAKAQQPAPADLVAILKTYANAGSASLAGNDCQGVAYGENTHSGLADKGEAQFKLHNYVEASINFKAFASQVANCAVGADSLGAQRIPLPRAFNQVGTALADAVLASSIFYNGQGATVPPEVRVDAQNAMSLLNNDPAANAGLILSLKKTGLFGTPAAAAGLANDSDAANGTTIPLTAKEAVTGFKSNAFAFKSRYAGKMLEISGPIQSIGDSGSGGATVTLVGYKPANMDNQGFQDLVRCDVSAPPALVRVAELKKGEKATVVGVYEPAKAVFGTIELQQCRTQ